MALLKLDCLAWVSLLAVCGILSGCSSGGAGALPPPAPPPTETEDPTDPMAGRFGPGDLLELYVKEDSTLAGNYLVREGGYIVIPRAGRVPVQGLDRSGAEAKLKEYLQKTQLTEATVLIERTPSRHAKAAARGGPVGVPKLMLYISGNVVKSGVHYIPVPEGKQLGIYEAILVSGGLGKFAQDNKVEVLRTDPSGRKHRAIVDLRAVREGKAIDPPVGDGDIINVPEKVFGF